MRVLIIEDEKAMAELLKKGLEEENHRVALAFNGLEGLELAKIYEFDAIVLDLMLPKVDGFEVARRLRDSGNQTPILILTARDSVPDIVKGLDLGADDYLTKPFSFEVFVARLRTVARRGSAPRPACLQVADLTLDPASHRAIRRGHEVPLTPTEYRLLEVLMRRVGRVVPRTTIVEAVWGLENDIEENTLDAFVRLLRTKVDKGFGYKLIHTVRGIGYCLRESSKQ